MTNTIREINLINTRNGSNKIYAIRIQLSNSKMYSVTGHYGKRTARFLNIADKGLYSNLKEAYIKFDNVLHEKFRKGYLEE
tara:strand:+ start:2835 stop:3077 length:243 start_codon:yes stop_codon:yes gene_type:complete